MDVGNVNSKHLLFVLKVKSILDPCDDESDDLQDNGMVNLGEDSVERDDSSDDSSATDMEVNHLTEEDHFVVAPVGKMNFFSQPHICSNDAFLTPQTSYITVNFILNIASSNYSIKVFCLFSFPISFCYSDV